MRAYIRIGYSSFKLDEWTALGAVPNGPAFPLTVCSKKCKMQSLRAISTRTILDFYTPLLPHSLPLTPVNNTHLNPVTCTEARAILDPRKEVKGCHENVFWKAKL